MTWKERLGRLRVDATPLRESRDFRLLFWAGTVFYLGAMVSYVAVPYQLYQLTGSNFAVGALGMAELLPLVVFGLWGGALADHVDRRLMLVTTGLAQIALTALLMLNALLPSPQVWPLYAVGALLSAAQSLQRPSREALVPRTVKHGQLPAAVSLSSLGMQIGLFLGPTAGGLLIQWVGVPWCFAVDVAGLVVATGLFTMLRPYPSHEDSQPPSLRGIMDGLTYAVRRRDLLGTYIVDIVAMVMAMPIVLFPAIAEDIFKTPSILGLLYTAETVGSLLATATSGWTARVHHHGRAVVIAAACWGGGIALAGISPTIWLMLTFLALAGAADMISGLFRGVIWNQTIPDSMRGRLAGIEMLSYSLGPLAGQTRAGIAADVWGVRAAITSGGLLCIAGVSVTAVWLRDFWSYDNRTDVHAVHEREVRAAAEASAASAASAPEG